MNWNEVEGKWNQLKGSVREKYGKLTDDDIQTIAGKKDRFLGKLQEHYGMSREQAEKELTAWMQNVRVPEGHKEPAPRTQSSGSGSSNF